SATESAKLAANIEAIEFTDSGWLGALVPTRDSAEALIVARYGGADSTVVALSSHIGAPVTVEEAQVNGTVSSTVLSNTDGEARIEPISCWLDAGPGGSIIAREGPEAGTAIIRNPGSANAAITAYYRSTGRPCTLTEEDGAELVSLPPRRSMG